MASESIEARLSVLGDSQRRAIFDLLSNGSRSVSEIAMRLPITRSAVSQHLRVLSDVGLVNYEPHGTAIFTALIPTRWRKSEITSTPSGKALARFKSRAERRR
jgi:DNA-binding transcriptional ArsR family regulator